MRYASNTLVSCERSRAEIESILSRYGAERFAYFSKQDAAAIAFTMEKRNIRFVLPLPDRSADRFWYTPGRHLKRRPDEAHREWEQACRQAWRALALCIKAKLEAVESSISTFEDEFLAWVVMPDGKTVGEHVRPSINAVYDGGKNIPLLPHFN